jgi:hypothetical protein
MTQSDDESTRVGEIEKDLGPWKGKLSAGMEERRYEADPEQAIWPEPKATATVDDVRSVDPHDEIGSAP